MTGCELTRLAQNALRHARESAARLGHGYVGSEHLLLGLLMESRGAAARVLKSSGIQEQAVRKAVAGLVGVGAQNCGPSQGLTPRCHRIIEAAAGESCRANTLITSRRPWPLRLLKERSSPRTSVSPAREVRTSGSMASRGEDTMGSSS